MLQRRQEDGFNLAFLDVMACGLGAVILIFMLVKFNAPSDEPVDEVKRLKAELAQLIAQQDNIKTAIATTDEKKQAQQLTLAQIKSRIETLKKLNAQAGGALDDQVAVLAELEKSIAAAAPAKAEDTLAMSGLGEETYLLGLKVEGSHIGILLDHSASMTDEKLVDIIRRKIGTDAEKQAARKWQRTRRVARWLLARVPQTSKVTVVGFSDTAALVGPKSKVSASNKTGMKHLASAIDALVPQEGTNLQTAIKTIAQTDPQMTDLYVITDGLPTMGERSSGLSAFRKCSSFFGKSTTITGECRQLLFFHTVKNAPLNGVKVNVILLPLEGDPFAPDAYWQWSASTGGLMISPARSWP